MIAALVLELEGAGLLPVLVPVDDEPEDVVAAADEEEEEAADEEVRVAMLMVVFRDNAVPVAAEPEAPAPVPAAPLAAVVVALLAEEVVLLLPEPPPITPPEAGFVPTVEVALTLALVAVDDEEEDVARAETARVGPEVAPPVRVIMPV